MRILLLGSGGREHALAWKIGSSKLCDQLFIAPGNGGTALCGTNIPLAVSDFDKIGAFCETEKIDMVIPGSEEPLVKGIYDYFQSKPFLRHIPVIGPSKAGAKLEGSKSFAKAFMHRHHIPTAAYQEFNQENFEEGKKYLQQHNLPIVLKADGLAAGKGVIICRSHKEAINEFTQILQQAKFGEAGNKVVVEEFLSGIELSVFVLTDGKNYLLLPEAKDYKRIGEGDTGLNTGGMGAVSPVPFADKQFMHKVTEQIIQPTITGLMQEKIAYRGFIFFGLIKVNNAPYVIEYNCRMGDPETEVVMPRLKNDLVELLNAAACQKLDKFSILKDARTAATIMLVSKGYPEKYITGKVIDQLPPFNKDQMIFQAGTQKHEGKLLTSGGRVISVTCLADTLQNALEKAKHLADEIQFDGKYYRKDIGWEFLS